MPFTQVVKFAAQLTPPAGGFVARFDSTGTYQPTIGNVVLFACPNFAVGGVFTPPVGWQLLTITTPSVFTTPNVIWKIWGAGDNTTSVIQAGFSTPYIAYEVQGVDPIAPILGCGFGFEQSPPNISIGFAPTVTRNGSTGIFLVYTQNNDMTGETFTPPLTYIYCDYDGAALGGVNGDVLGGEAALGAGDVPLDTAFNVPTRSSPFTPGYEAAIPIFQPPLSTVTDATLHSDTEEFVYLREAFSL